MLDNPTQNNSNEFTKTTGKTAPSFCKGSNESSYIYMIYLTHIPGSAKMFEQTQQELSGVDNIHTELVPQMLT